MYQTMDMILAAKGNSITWGMNQKWKFSPVHLINEPDNKKENNTMFIHAFVSKQTNPNWKNPNQKKWKQRNPNWKNPNQLTPAGYEPKRHKLFVISHKVIHPGQPICAFYRDAFNQNNKYKAHKQDDIVESQMVDDQLLSICTNSQGESYYKMDTVTNCSIVNTHTRKSARRRLMIWAKQNIV